MPELLLEVLSEEIPARMQARAAADLQRLVRDGLKAARLDFGESEAHAGPRRLVLVLRDLDAAQPDLSEEKRGPREGAPDKAIEGFLRANGLTREDLELREVKKGRFWFARIEQRGEATAALLPDLIAEALAAVPWPKSMRWGAGDARWVRPLHAILCLFDGAVVPVRFAGIVAGAETRGHPVHAPAPFAVRDFEDYRARLWAACVLIDAGERRALIENRARQLAEAAGLALRDDPGLLDEIAGLVEWPMPLIGRIDDDLMALPPEVLTTALKVHQRYLTLTTPDGELAPRFIAVANIDASDGGDQVIRGNETVLRARLADAKFFWDEDRKVSLESRLDALDGMIFHEKLGSMRAKAVRIETLAGEIAAAVADAEPDLSARAARLAKTDLMCEMVGEFPELQGIMGGYYAENDGEAAEVAAAIRDHYRPAGPADMLPRGADAAAVALADKLDTVAGFFAVGLRPTGSGDPFGLRRAALGIIRIVLEHGLRLPMLAWFRRALALHGHDDSPLADDLLVFFAERLKVHLRGDGVRHDCIDAVFKLKRQDDMWLLDWHSEELNKFLESEDGANLLTAYRRAANILAIEEKRDETDYSGAPEPDRFEAEAETALLAKLNESALAAESALREEEFEAAMSAMAGLRGPLDRFFDEVKVNADDPAVRVNRLHLLAEIRRTLHQVADFSQLEG